MGTHDDDARRQRFLDGLAKLRATRAAPEEEPPPSSADDSSQDMTRKPFPEPLRRLVAPWWSARAAKLAEALEAALEAGIARVPIDGKLISVERLTELAAQALKQVERLAQPEP